MTRPLVDQIADAVLYEGYVLYPYRPAVKNQQRWTFGELFPRAYCEAQAGSEASRMQIECIVRGDDLTRLRVRVRFLHLMARTIGVIDPPRPNLRDDEPLRFVDSLQVGEQVFQPWQEAVEREAGVGPWRLGDRTSRRRLTWPASRRREAIRNPASAAVGVILREQHAIAAMVELSAKRCGDDFFKLRVIVENQTNGDAAARWSHDDAVLRGLASTHAVLEVEQGAFLSMTVPPADAKQLAQSCNNVGAWPVLVGMPGQSSTMLAAPIILYDYPQIAGASPSNLFDGTEIDEILSLRILTLSEEERLQAASLDERVRDLLTRTEALDRQQFAQMHGVMHEVRS